MTQEFLCSSAGATPGALPRGDVQVLGVDDQQEGLRLDVFLVRRLGPAASRAQVARMIRAGAVTINGTATRPAATVRAGDRIEIKAQPWQPSEYMATPPKLAQASPLEQLFADNEIIVVNKPPGLAVHPAPTCREPTLVELLLASYPELATMVDPDGVLRPGIVHRLDKGTSGVMVIARTPFARAALARQFKERTTSKVYLAAVRGTIANTTQIVALPIGRHPRDRTRMSVRPCRARDALTAFTVVERLEVAQTDGPAVQASLLRVEPKTGRTHQIRVHLAALGHPCIGDPVYGGRSQAKEVLGKYFERQALHALSLSFDHPRTAARMHFVATLPQDFAHFLNACGVKVDAGLLDRWIGGKVR